MQQIAAPATTSAKRWRSTPTSLPGHTVLLSEHAAQALEQPRGADSPRRAASTGLAPARGKSQRSGLLLLLAALSIGGCGWLWMQQLVQPWSRSQATGVAASSVSAVAPIATPGAPESRGPLTESAAPAARGASSATARGAPSATAEAAVLPPPGSAAPPRGTPAALPPHARKLARRPVPENRADAPSAPQPLAVSQARLPDVRPDTTATANAIEQLALGHPREALAAYLRLAQARPEHPAYATLVRILQRKLRARCAERAQAEGTACQEIEP